MSIYDRIAISPTEVIAGSDYMTIRVGMYDPNDGTLPGGGSYRRFDFSRQAEVHVNTGSRYGQPVTPDGAVTVSQAAPGSQDLEWAEQRAAVFAKAIEVGHWFTLQLGAGATLEQIAEQLVTPAVLSGLGVEVLA